MVDLKIPLKLDSIFLYFETRKLTKDEIDHCEYIETVCLCPEGPEWDPYDQCFANREEGMVDFKGDTMVPDPKRSKLLESRDVFELSVTEEQYEAAISLIVANNCCNQQEG